MVAPSASSLSHLKFRHLMLVAHLSEFGTLHKAANALNISQPAATAMLNDLEALLGLKLFERSHRGVKATDTGSQVLSGLETLRNEYHHFAQSLNNLAHGRERVLRVGLVPHAFATHLPRVLAQFRAGQGCAIRAREGTATQLLASLWDGQLDCVVGRLAIGGPDQTWDLAALQFESLYAEPICVVCGETAATVKPSLQTFQWLAQQSWILQRPDSSVRQALNEAFLRHGVAPPAPAVETGNYLQSLALVSESAFFTVAPRSAVELQRTRGALRVLGIDLGVSPMQISFIHRAASQNDAQLQAFKACFKRVARKEVARKTQAVG